MAKIYTRGGDTGTTAHPRVGRARKSEWSIEVAGRFDEAQVAIGYALSLCSEPPFDRLKPTLEKSISLLGECATSALGDRGVAYAAAFIELSIDKLEADLEPISEFVRTDGSDLYGRLHQARVAVRRLERGIWQAYDGQNWSPIEATPFINRLSDYLFVAARWVKSQDG